MHSITFILAESQCIGSTRLRYHPMTRTPSAPPSSIEATGTDESDACVRFSAVICCMSSAFRLTALVSCYPAAAAGLVASKAEAVTLPWQQSTGGMGTGGGSCKWRSIIILAYPIRII